MTKEELLFLSECLISYQAYLSNLKHATFGNVSTAADEQLSKISELNQKIITLAENQ